MIINDNNIMKFLHKVYEEICKFAFDNNLNEESIENIIQELISVDKFSMNREEK